MPQTLAGEISYASTHLTFIDLEKTDSLFNQTTARRSNSAGCLDFDSLAVLIAALSRTPATRLEEFYHGRFSIFLRAALVLNGASVTNQIFLTPADVLTCTRSLANY